MSRQRFLHLILTAEKEFWLNGRPVILLGDWCLGFFDRQKLQDKHPDVFPYHWDDLQKRSEDFTYLKDLYERVLKSLYVNLNEIHGVEYSLRYWRILMGPWLEPFIFILYDRYESIRLAAESRRITDTCIGIYKSEDWILRDNLDYARCQDSDKYNQYLFGQLIRKRGDIPYTELPVNESIRDWIDARFKKKSKFSLKEFSIRQVSRLSKFIPSRFNRVVMIGTCLTPRDQAVLQLSLGQIPYLLPPDPPQIWTRMNKEMRMSIRIKNLRRDGFEGLLEDFIRDNIHFAFLEGYTEMNNTALECFPKNPKAIFTAYAYDGHEFFRFWAAHHVERGVKFLGTQHGCYYGSTRWFREEDHQLAIYDRFYSWGWTHSGKNTFAKIIPLPTGKFNRLLSEVKQKKGSKILLVGTVWPKYAYKPLDVPLSSTGVIKYLDDQYRFIGRLDERSRKLVLFRAFPSDRGWNQVERMREKFPDIESYIGYGKTLFDQMNESKIIVSGCNSTPQLESFVVNMPTIIYLDQNVFRQREAATPFYNDLERVGVLHASPEAAADKVMEIFDDPLSWWMRPEVQEVRSRFVHKFARTMPGWLKKWKHELTDI